MTNCRWCEDRQVIPEAEEVLVACDQERPAADGECKEVVVVGIGRANEGWFGWIIGERSSSMANYDAAVAFTVVQLTDTHIGAPWSDDATAALAGAVDAIRKLLPRVPDAVVVTGDVANTPVDSEYEQARALLDRLEAPVYVVAGNHDDRNALRGHFKIPDTSGEQLDYAVELGRMRLIALDTKRADSDAGRLEPAQLAWLDDQLAEAQATPTLIIMHHPPLVAGVPWMEKIGIPADECAAMEAILSRHKQVQLIACGHVHRTVVGRLAAANVLAIPSTDVQLALDLEAKALRFVPEPPCFAVHLLVGDRLISHIQPVDR